MKLNYQEAKEDALAIMQNSSVFLKKDEINSKIKVLAEKINEEIQDEIPIFLTVMNGGLFFAAELLKQIKNPFLMDYLHATRYRGDIRGAQDIIWHYRPQIDLFRNKTVYVIDDILDEGHTLVEINRFLLSNGAKCCKIVVLIDKILNKTKPITADYVVTTAPNHYLFGYGMDIFGMYRQLTDIYIYNQ